MAFFNMRKQKINEHLDEKIDHDNIPEHVAIIMDGNGRWAKRQLMPRVAGHKAGMDTVKTITTAASRLGIKVLTLYAFSTENWKRPKDEVNFLMQLPVEFFDTFVPDLIKENVKVNVMGYLNQLPEKTQESVRNAIADTADNTGMILNFALNYGGRSEITTAVQKIAQDIEKHTLSSADISEQTIDAALMTASLGQLANPDLVIRTSGEQRISNFLLWQIAYSELVFMDDLWPNFTEASLKDAIIQYQQRQRRFGGIQGGKV